MKQRLQQVVKKIDAMTLRERVITFVTAVVLMLYVVNALLIDPQFDRQKKLTQQIQQDQAKIAEIQGLIQQKIASHSSDPDLDSRVRLQLLKQQHMQAQSGLLEMQKGLISPDKMPGLLEDILKRHGALRLQSLKTLPASALGEPEQAGVATANSVTTPVGPAKATEGNLAETGLYKHGVEITVQGSYLDMLQYLAELEAMPWQIFWGKAKFNVDDYPTATLTLTLFTLSLDKTWLHL